MLTGEDRVLLYGADWCADTRRARAWLTRHDVPFTACDTSVPEVRARAAELAGGRGAIPVLVAPDGTVLVEPTNVDLAVAFAGSRRRRVGDRSGCR